MGPTLAKRPLPNPAESSTLLKVSLMKLFSSKAFEHLLFPLHRSAYLEIDRQLQAFEQHYPGSLAGLCKIFDLNFANPTSEGALVPQSALVRDCPTFDIHVRVDESRMHRLRKCNQVGVQLLRQPAEMGDQRGNCNHLIVGLRADEVQQNFIVPLPLVLQALEARVCKPATYQVYQHTLIRKKGSAPTTVADYLDGAGQYVGITGRTWQQRALEHQYAARRGSYLLFHRALREELFEVFAHEHIVLRAGLGRAQALQIEEVEVEERTLHYMHPNGLNMIPGGEAGLRFLSSMTKRPASTINLETIDDLLEAEVNRSLRQPGLTGLPTNGCNSNPKLAALWKTNLDYRIRAMTGSDSRLSYRQICNARLWHACGWPLDKIWANLNGMDGRVVSHDQLQRLLDGKSYQSIPHVLIPATGSGAEQRCFTAPRHPQEADAAGQQPGACNPMWAALGLK